MTDATVLAEAPPLARVYGEPILQMPQDLYIPPDALEVILDAFEGPLDLLLYLIRKHNLDILDIPMAELTRQYMVYVDLLRHTQLELAAEYLVMAAMLTEIKSRMLLPRPPKAEDNPEEDPRAQLVRRLLEYEQMKYAAHKLETQPQVGRDITLVQVYLERVAEVRMPQVSVLDLQSAWESLVARAKNNRHHRITRHELSVREHMTQILRALAHGRFVEFIELFNPAAGVPELVVTFLAILELAKERLIEVTQQAVYAPIYVKRLESEDHGRESE